MGFDDLCDIGLVLGLGISSSGVGKSAATQKLDDPSLTLSKGHHNLLPPKKSTEFYGQDSAVSSLSNVSVKREREIGSEKVDRVWSRVRDEDEDDGSNGRKKLRLTKAQSAVLEESFNHHTTLNPKQKQELAMELKLSPRQVEVWFQNRRARYKLIAGAMDTWSWKHCNNGIYKVSLAYDLLLERKLLSEVSAEKEMVYRRLWTSYAIRKAAVTGWKIIKEKMATTDNLARRGINLNEEEKTCALCRKEKENIRHLFFECTESYKIWCNLYSWLGVQLVLHINPSSHFLQFCECLGRGEKVKIAATIWIGTVWSIWNLRNDIIFNKATLNTEREISKIKINVWNWISVYNYRLLDSNIGNWFSDPRSCLEVM